MKTKPHHLPPWTVPLLLGAAIIAIGANIADTDLTKEANQLSYGIGLQIGKSLGSQNIDINTSVFIRGLQDGHSGQLPLLTTEQLRHTTTVLLAKMGLLHADAESGGQAKNQFNTGIFSPVTVIKQPQSSLPEKFEY